MPNAAPRIPTTLFRVADLRALETRYAATLPPHTLMAHAGAVAADWLYAQLSTPAKTGRRPILFLAGPGNNGGDAYVAARKLSARGVSVRIWQIAPPSTDDARWAHTQALTAGIPIDPPPETWPESLKFDWVVDGMFGIGLSRPLEGAAAALAMQLNTRRAKVLALDIPSGLPADTGQPTGIVLRATATLAFLGATPGLLTGLGRNLTGVVRVASLGLTHPQAQCTPAAAVVSPHLFAAHLPYRHPASHKGTHGSLAIVGGHDGMVGAPLLSARAGLYGGAGRVYVGFVASGHPAYDPVQPELMLRHAENITPGAMQAIAIGPGLGTDAASSACLTRMILHTDTPLVLDADALNLLASEPANAKYVRARKGPTVLTPHPLEAARLAGCHVTHVQANRLDIARTLAKQFNAVVVLKGAGSVIDDGQQTWINPTGNAALATAGTGDVLTGLIGALLAQGMPTSAAVLAAVWLHGYAADRLVAHGVGPAGLTASELLPTIREVLNRQMNHRSPTPPK